MKYNFDELTYRKAKSELESNKKVQKSFKQRAKHSNDMIQKLSSIQLIEDKIKALEQELNEHIIAREKLEKANQYLKELSERDGLTGVYNRRKINSTLKEFENIMSMHLIHVLMIDIDRFKSYNDTFGHLQGDNTLKAIASFLDAKFHSENGFFGRFGGEEFIGIFIDRADSFITEFANELVHQVREMAIYHPDSGFGVITLSIGVASNKIYTSGMEDLINRADQNLYKCKLKGRNQVYSG